MRAGLGSTLKFVFLFSLAVLHLSSIRAEARESAASIAGPLSPQETLKHFQLAPGLRLELVAAEPLVVDPVEITFDEDGKLWVVEMIDYPYGPKPGAAPLSRVRILEDLDGDGYFETSRVFVDELLSATGIQLWKGGAFVTLSGRLMYFRDTDGDGRADLEQTWFTGFAEKNEQLRANHPRLGLDHRIYVANGLRGGSIVGHLVNSNQSGQERPGPVSISGMDLRFDPLTGAFETVSGAGQFGLTFDDFGNRYVCSNRNPIKHIVLENRYIKRNSFMAVTAVHEDVAPAGPESRVYPLSTNWTHSSLHAGQFTAACGVFVYRGASLPGEFQGNSFVCEPTGNLVHRDVMTPRGATFTSHSGRRAVEFLASPDDWFRPVNLASGPDGALYIVDMYRAVIEHPHWLPEEMVARIPIHEGNDRGRIYRVVPEIPQPRQRAPRLSRETGTELVRRLSHPDAWWRKTAARLIHERQDKSLQPALETMIRRSPLATARVHALWTLAGLGALSQETIDATLDDSHPRVREHAVVLSESWLRESTALEAKVIALAADDDARLRYQVALSLGEGSASPTVLDALKRVALRDAGDAWATYAVMSSAAGQTGRLIERILSDADSNTSHAREDLGKLLHDLAETVGSRQNLKEIAGVLQAVVSPDAQLGVVQIAILSGLGRGAQRRGDSLMGVVDRLAKQGLVRKDAIERLFLLAASDARDRRRSTLYRERVIDLLRHVDFEIAGEPLLELAQAEETQSLRLRAINILANHGDPRIADTLLVDFASQTPPVRRAVLDAMLGDPDRTRTLLDEIAAARISATELDPQRVEKLLKQKNTENRKRAKELLADFVPADRKEVLTAYRAALTLKADSSRGRLVFEKNCAVCHKISTIGVNVGPDISDSLRKSPEALLTSIVVPNQAIDTNYVSYTVVTDAGETLSGIIAQENASSVTLRQAENKTVTFLRQDIAAIRSTGISLMPDGLEKNVTVAQMADLISFIKNWQYVEGRVPSKGGDD